MEKGKGVIILAKLRGHPFCIAPDGNDVQDQQYTFPGKFIGHKFMQRYETSNYNIRNCRNLEIPKTNLKKAKEDFHHTDLKICNSIPNDVRELPLLNQFRNSLKTNFFIEPENPFFCCF